MADAIPFPEGSRVRNKRTGERGIVLNGEIVPIGEDQGPPMPPSQPPPAEPSRMSMADYFRRLGKVGAPVLPTLPPSQPPAREPMFDYLGRSPVIEMGADIGYNRVIEPLERTAGAVGRGVEPAADYFGALGGALGKAGGVAYQKGVMPAAEALGRSAARGLETLGRGIIPPPRELTAEERRYYLDLANGDVAAARQRAISDGYAWPED